MQKTHLGSGPSIETSVCSVKMNFCSQKLVNEKVMTGFMIFNCDFIYNMKILYGLFVLKILAGDRKYIRWKEARES